MQRRLNVSLLVKSVAVVVVFGVAVYFVHGYQVRRNAHYLLQRADEAYAAKEFDTALLYYGQYLTFAPGDLDAAERFALTLDQTTGDLHERVRLVLRFEDILRRDPQRHQVRYRLVQNLMALMRFKDAVPHLQALLGTGQDDAETYNWLGLCQQALGDAEGAVTTYTQAIAKTPTRLESYVLLAELQHMRFDRGEEADQTMERLIKANPKSYRAYLARSDYERQRGRRAEAEKFIQQATQLAPDEPTVLVAAARWAEGAGRLDEARQLVERGLAKSPDHAGLYKALADLDLREGKRDAAVRALEQGLQRVPAAGDLQAQLIDLLIDDKKLEDAAAQLADLRRVAPGVGDYLKARLVIDRQDWALATELLENARAAMAPQSPWAGRTNALLGLCYEQTGDTERRLAAFRRALQLEPTWAAAHYGVGTALLAAGQPEEALLELGALSNDPAAPPGVWTALARAHLLAHLRRPAAQRDWEGLEALLGKADSAIKNNADAALIRAQMLVAQDRRADAIKLLEQRRTGDRQAVYWFGLAELAAQQSDGAAALAILADAEKTFGDSSDLRLARAQVYAQRGAVEDRAALAKLTSDLAGLPEPAQVRVLRGSAEAWQRLGDLRSAQVVWHQIAKMQPADLPSRSALLDAALAEKDAAAARTVIAELRQIEGEAGVLWRYGGAALQVLEAGSSADKLQAARAAVREVAGRKRGWARLATLEAQIDEQLGRWDHALQHYLQGIEQGQRDARVLQHTLDLLLQRRRFVPAEQVLLKLEEQGPLPRELARTAAEVALVNRNPARVLRLISQAAPVRARDYRDLLWLARIDLGLDEPTKAEAWLRKAVQQAEHVPETWIALAEHLTRTGQQPAALALVESIPKKMPPRRAAFTRARCWEVMGEEKRALEAYERALAETPRDVALLTAALNFHRRADRLAATEPLAQRLLDPTLGAPPDVVAAARRQLALVVAGRGNDTQAFALLDLNHKAFGSSAADARVRSHIEAKNPYERPKALERLKESFRQWPSEAEEELLLARSYADDPARARAVLADLLTVYESPQVLADYVRVLVQQGDVSDAVTYFARLERFEPHTSRTAELKALLLKARS